MTVLAWLYLLLPTIAGATNPAVTQGTINATICVPGWTSTVRPSASYTNRLKLAQVGPANLAAYEEDHLIPLELGGAPRSTRNLWAEPWPQAHRSDPVENRLHKLVCAGSITLREGRRQIRAYKLTNG